MKMTSQQLNRLFYLLGALRDGIVTEAEFADLNTMLENSPQAQEYYLDYIYLCTDLCNLQAAIKQDAHLQETIDRQDAGDLSAPPLTLDMLRVWGDYERKAETLNLPDAEADEKAVVGKVQVNVPPRKISKLSVVTLVTSLAAMLFLVLYVHLNPRAAYEVATLSEAVGAEWSYHLPPQKGTRLSVSSDDPVQLQKGVIEIASDKDVVITIEGPAEFSFISPDEILMNYGRLFATVSPAGNGFSVRTSNSKIIDLGTSFGVYADTRGQTELHVFKGNTILIAGQKGQNKQTIEVAGGRACRVDSNNGYITDINLDHNMFARGIDPDTGLLITGGKQIDLADILGGGDGSGSGSKNQAIRWDGARFAVSADTPQGTPAVFPSDYVPVSWNSLIDGVFVPNCVGEKPRVLKSTVSTLNLDDFVAADTNGLITLVLLHETTDENAAYWFASKETAANDPEKCPALIFPDAGPALVTTAHKNGADAYVSNDALRAPTVTLGEAPDLTCRYLKDRRIRIMYLRFDISGLSRNLTDAVLSLYLNSGNRFRNLHVYGLKDGPADNWDEKTINFNTAPGLLPAAFGNYQLNENSFDFLGTFRVVDNRIITDPIQVSADNASRWNAPNTMCQSTGSVSNARWYYNENGSVQTLMLGNTRCGTDDNPAISMHANAGITFDLNAVRRQYGPVEIESFTATCGMANPASSGINPNGTQTSYPATASFYVLVDGQEAFSAVDTSPAESPRPVEIRLDSRARYLTLVVTQGTDNSIAGDRCIFVKPALHLK